MAAMQSTLAIGLTSTKRLEVDDSRCIGFMGKEGMVYATPSMVNDVEYACHDLLGAHLDDGEDSVGAHVAIDHLAATPLGFEVTIEVRIVELDRRRVTFELSVRDAVEECGRGRHVRFVVDKARAFERITAKRAKLGR